MDLPSNACAPDDWDQHWAQFGQTSEVGPTPRYRRRLIHTLLGVSGPGDGIRFLEIGSGMGEFAQDFCERHPNAKYLGLELSRNGVAIARTRVPSATFLQKDLLKGEENDEYRGFGATHALCSEVLEHLDNPEVLLGNAKRYLSPQCRLIVSVPGGPMNMFYRHIGHRRHYSAAELASLLEKCGFTVEAAFGSGFPFFNLFRILIGLRGQQLVTDVSGTPSVAIRFASLIFDGLFRLNSRKKGWQTFAVARLS
jgi:SAM-dependent methyltransferase